MSSLGGDPLIHRTGPILKHETKTERSRKEESGGHSGPPQNHLFPGEQPIRSRIWLILAAYRREVRSRMLGKAMTGLYPAKYSAESLMKRSMGAIFRGVK